MMAIMRWMDACMAGDAWGPRVVEVLQTGTMGSDSIEAGEGEKAVGSFERESGSDGGLSRVREVVGPTVRARCCRRAFLEKFRVPGGGNFQMPSKALLACSSLSDVGSGLFDPGLGRTGRDGNLFVWNFCRVKFEQ